MTRRCSGLERRLGLVVITLALSVVTTGCHWNPFRERPVFPRLDTADQQFFYATDLQQRALVPRGTKGKEKLRWLIAAYQTVIDHFPDDDTYVPLAYAAIGNCYFQMEDYRRTIRIYKEAMARYPDYPFLHAEGAWKIGRSYDLLGKPARAKQYYRSCIDTFRHSKNERILTFVALCQKHWREPSLPGGERR